MDAPQFVLAGGGTGGHLYPGIAVAHAIQRLRPDARVTFLTTSRDLDRQLLERTPFGRLPQTVRPFSTKPWQWPAFYFAWASSVRAAKRLLREKRAAAVLGLGGYAAGPPVVAAQNLGIRAGILNPDAIPGRANRFLAKRCQLVCLQWDESRRYFPPTAPCQTLGCPIREAFGGATVPRAEARRHFNLHPEQRVVLVTGASQGASTINNAIPRIWPEFSRRFPGWQIFHLTGAAHEVHTRAAYAAAGIPATVLGFTHDMPIALSAADIVISRAGASTLAELTALGRASILLPYPYHRDRHQHANAQVLVDRGAALLMDDLLDAEKNAPQLLDALAILADDARRTATEAAARTLGRPHAADAVAAWMLDGAK